MVVNGDLILCNGVNVDLLKHTIEMNKPRRSVCYVHTEDNSIVKCNHLQFESDN